MAILGFTQEALDYTSQLLHGSGVDWKAMHSNVYQAEDRARVISLLVADQRNSYLQEISEQLGDIAHNFRAAKP